jgi:hypothetical protein
VSRLEITVVFHATGEEVGMGDGEDRADPVRLGDLGPDVGHEREDSGEGQDDRDHERMRVRDLRAAGGAP